MFWTILALLVTLWTVGMVTSHRMGGLIHGLPVVAVVLLVVRLASGMFDSPLKGPGESSANNEVASAGAAPGPAGTGGR